MITNIRSLMIFNTINEKKLAKWASQHKYEKIAREILNKDQSLREKAFSLLMNASKPQHPDLLLSMIHSPHQKVRKGAAKALLMMSQTDPARGASLLEQYNQLHADIQPYILALLGKNKTIQAKTLLIKELEEGEKSTKQICADALIALGAHATTDLLTHYETSNDNTVKQYVLEVLAKTADPASIELLKKQLASPMQNHADLAIEGLIKIGQEALPATLESLKDPKTEAQACLILASIGTKEQIPDLTLTIQQSKSKDAVANAILALGNIRNDSVINEILSVLQSPAYQDNKISKEHTTKEKELISQKNKEKRTVRRQCLRSLGMFHTPNLYPVLLDGLKDPALHEAAAEAILLNGKELIQQALDKDPHFYKEALFLAKKYPQIQAEVESCIADWKNRK